MSSTELLNRSLFLFGDNTPGSVLLWIRDAGAAGSEGVPCSIASLEGVLKGVPCTIAAPGVECALNENAGQVEVQLERPGGNRVSWSIPNSTFRDALDRLKD